MTKGNLIPESIKTTFLMVYRIEQTGVRVARRVLFFVPTPAMMPLVIRLPSVIVVEIQR